MMLNKLKINFFAFAILFSSFVISIDIVELKQEKETWISYTTESKNYFYIDLAQYFMNEEGSVTMHYREKEDLKAFNGKYISKKRIDELLPYFPIDKSYYPVIQSEYPDYNYLFFKKEDKETQHSYLMLYLEFKSSTSTTKSISLLLSHKEKLIDVNQKNQYTLINLESFIPLIYKFRLTKEIDDGETYIFYSPLQKYQTVFIGDITSKDSMININVYNQQLVSYTFSEDSELYYQIIISIVFFGPEAKMNLEILNTDISSLYQTEKPIEALHIEPLHPFHPFLLMGIYKEKGFESIIYFERLYGSMELYYKNEIKETEIRNILPGEIDRYSNDFYIKSSTDTDLIMAKCLTPCGFNINYISYNTPNEIQPGERVFKYFKAEEEATFSIPQYDLGINIEIYNIENKKELTISVFGNVIDSFDYIYRKHYTVEEIGNNKIVIKSMKEALISITIGLNDYTQITEKADITKHRNVFIFENDPNIVSTTIELVNLDTKIRPDISYYFGYGDINYIQDTPINTLSNFNLANFTMSNPYLASPPYTDSNSKYYLIINVNRETDNPNISLTPWTSLLSNYITLDERRVYKVVSPSSDLFNLSKIINESKTLMVFITKCNPDDLIMKYKYGNKVIQGFSIKNRFAFEIYFNPSNNTMVQFAPIDTEAASIPSVLIYYAYPSKYEASEIAFSDEFDISHNDRDNNATSIELRWRSPLLNKVNYDVSYSIYIYNQTNPATLNEYDVCRLLNVIPNHTVYSNEINVRYTIALDRNYTNNIFISAFAKKGISPMFYYQTIQFTSVTTPVNPPDENNNTFNWIWYIVIGLAVIILCLAGGYIYRCVKKNKELNVQSISNEALIDY